MKLIKYPHDILREKVRPITDFGASLKRQGNEMYDIMVSLEGAGLAANQVGINKRLFVLKEGLLPHRMICNPDWQWDYPYKNNSYVDLEGCLSFPNVFIPVVRYRKILIAYQDYEGNKHIQQVNGFAARVVQHETEHLEGVLFIDHDNWSVEDLLEYENSLKSEKG